LKEIIQKKIFNFFLNNNVENFVGVPDSTIKHFIKEGIKHKKILITTREEEAIGIAVGHALSNSNSLVFMQNAGLGNSISTITSLVQLYNIPQILLVGWRGYLSNDAPEHLKFGKIQPRLIQLLGLKSKVITEKNWKECCRWALSLINNQKSCLLIVRREFND